MSDKGNGVAGMVLLVEHLPLVDRVLVALPRPVFVLVELAGEEVKQLGMLETNLRKNIKMENNITYSGASIICKRFSTTY